MSILDLIPSGQERTAAKQKAEQFLDEKARYFLGPQGYNLASGIVNIPQYLLSAVDIRDYYKSGADLAEKLSKGQFDQSTLESGLDTLGSAAGILIPGVTYRGVKEGFGFLNPFRKNEDFTKGIDFDLKNEISEEELSDTVFYRGERKGRSREGFGKKDDKLVYVSKDPEHAEQYAKDFSAETVDDSGKAVLDFSENTQIYKTRIPKDLNLFTYDNPEHIALATSWGKKNQSVLRAKFPTDKRGRRPFNRWLSKLRMGNFDAIEVPEFTDFLRKQGFDGHYTAELYPSKDGPKYATNVAVYNPGNVISEFDPRINKQRVSGGEDFVPDLIGGANPKRFYHGTSKKFKDFDPDASVTFVADEPSTAAYYAGDVLDSQGDVGPNIRPVYLKDVNFFDVDNPDHLNQLLESDWYAQYGKSLDDVFFDYSEDMNFLDLVEAGDYGTIEDSGLVDWIRSQGFDGFTTYEQDGKNYGVFDVKNIVSGVEKKAYGGIAGMGHIAKNMFRGPQGISSFQQFIAKPQRPMVS